MQPYFSGINVNIDDDDWGLRNMDRHRYKIQ